MKLDIVEELSSGATKLRTLNIESGKGVARFMVQSGRTLSIFVDGRMLGHLKAGERESYKLVKDGKDLVIVEGEGNQQVLVLQNFYNASEVTVSGDQWLYTVDSQLQAVGDGLALMAIEPSVIAAKASSLTTLSPIQTLGLAGLGAAVLAGGGGGESSSPIDASTAAIGTISAAAKVNNATARTPDAATYARAGVAGVDSTNLAAINSALNSANVNGAAVDTQPKIQALVDSYNAILAAADGTAGNIGTAPTAQNYANVGVSGVTASSQSNLLSSVIDGLASTAVDTVPELQVLADAAAHVMAAANTADGNATGSEVTVADLSALGITGVTAGSLAAVQAAIVAKANNGSGVDTQAKLQALVTDVDLTAPTAPANLVVTDAVAPNKGNLSSGSTSNDTQPTIGGAAGAVEAGGTVHVYDGASLLGTTTAAADGSWSFTPSAPLSEATHTLTATATDAAGNVSLASNAFTLTIDTTAPTATISTAAFSADTGTSNSDFVTKTAAQTISGTMSANMLAGQTVYVSLDNGGSWTAASTSVGANTWSLAGQTLSAGNTLKVKVSDAAGNDGAEYSHAFVLDTTAVSPSLAPAADTGPRSADGITNNSTVNVRGLETGATWQYQVDGSSGGVWEDGTGTSFTLINGTHTYAVRQVDVAGNSSANSGAATYMFDTTAPTMTSSTPADGAKGIDKAANLTFTFSEDIAIGTGSIVLHNITASTDTTIAVADASQVSISGSTLTLNPTANLIGYSDSYSVHIDNTAIQDLAGNHYAGIASNDNTTLNFDIAATPPAVISMGNWGGQLIEPTQVGGKWYYVLDYNMDGKHDSTSINGVVDGGVSMDKLEQLFFGSSTGTVITDSNRTVTLANGVTLMLPTYGDAQAAMGVYKNGTAVNSPTQTNPTYQGLLAIWDAYNGSTTGSFLSPLPPGWDPSGVFWMRGTPPGWASAAYWSSTPTGIGSHATLFMGNGYANLLPDNYGGNLAFQVL